MPFADMMNDTIELLKTDGTKKTGLKASVQKSKILMEANGILVEPQDLIIRKMSTGGEETYRVIDPGFYEDIGGINAHYQMEDHKLGLPEAKTAVQNNTYNITGNNARVNQNSVDNSSNVVQIDARAIHYVEALRKEIDGLNLSVSEKVEANEIIDDVESAFRSGNPKRSVVTALLKALPQAANVASIVSALASLAGVVP
jgi:hypothetical protein